MLKELLKRLLGDELLGVLDYYRSPEWRMNWGGPFNGQRVRQELFLALCRSSQPLAVVETGTHVGTTTEFIAETFTVPLFTVEYVRRTYGFAKARLRRYPHVKLYSSDSCQFLRELIRSELLPTEPILFYLDAHGGKDLPLKEELEIIFNSCAQAVVMVDDFQVPWEPGYRFDDYGEGKALTSQYIAPVVARFGLVKFYPAATAEEETGKRRGCVVLVKKGQLAERLAEIKLLWRSD